MAVAVLDDRMALVADVAPHRCLRVDAPNALPHRLRVAAFDGAARLARRGVFSFGEGERGAGPARQSDIEIATGWGKEREGAPVSPSPQPDTLKKQEDHPPPRGA